jgi:hypothetical protein
VLSKKQAHRCGREAKALNQGIRRCSRNIIATGSHETLIDKRNSSTVVKIFSAFASISMVHKLMVEFTTAKGLYEFWIKNHIL